MDDYTPEEREDGKRIAELERENAKLREELVHVREVLAGSNRNCDWLRAELKRVGNPI